MSPLRPPTECAQRCLQLLRDVDKGDWQVLGVAGESGAGKTTLARAIVDVVNDHAVLVHQDEFFFLPPAENHQARLADLGHVGPGEVDVDALLQKVTTLRAMGRRVVVEGTYVMRHDAGIYDARVFIDRTFQQTQQDRRRRGRDAMDPFVEEVLAIEQPLIRAFAARADIVVDDSFCPRLS